MNLPVILICAVCLVAAVLLDNRFQIPLGATTMLAAFVICNTALGMNANAVINNFFPGTIVMPLILAMIFFSVFTANGTAQVIARNILGLIRGNMKLYPWTLLVLSTVLYTFLDGSALRYVIGPLVFSVAKAGKGNTLMAVSTAYLPYVAGSMNPYIGVDAAGRNGILADMGLENGPNVSVAMWLVALVLILLLHLAVYLLTRSWQVPNMDFQGEESEPLTPSQKRSFVLLAAVMCLFILPPLLKVLIPCSLTNQIATVMNNYTVFLCGILALILAGLGDWRTMLRSVSLKPIMMIIGVTFLMKTAQQAGLQELCTMAASSVPGWLIPSALLLIGAALSFFVAAPTVQPMLFPMVAAMASTPAQAITYLSCIALGLAISGISPISNSGVAFLSTIDIKDHDQYSGVMFRMAFLGPVILALLAATGLPSLISSAFAGWYY